MTMLVRTLSHEVVTFSHEVVAQGTIDRYLDVNDITSSSNVP